MIKYFIDDYELKFAPNGWRDEAIKIIRNEKKGFYREVTQELIFIKDGAELLRRNFYQYGQNAIVAFKIVELNKLTLNEYDLFNGHFNFETFNDTEEGVTISAIDGTASGILKAKMKQTYDIKLDSTINMKDCRAFLGKAILSKVSSFMIPMRFFSGFQSFKATLGLDVQTNDDKTRNKYEVLNQVETNQTLPFVRALDSLTFKFNIDIPSHDVNITIPNPQWQPSQPRGINFSIRLIRINTTLQRQIILHERSINLVNGSQGGFINFTVPDIKNEWEIEAVTGETFALMVFVNTQWAGYNVMGDIVRYTPGEIFPQIEVNVASIMNTFPLKCGTAEQIFYKLIEKIDNSLVPKSNYLAELCGVNSDKVLLFLAGDSLRVLRGKDTILKISLEDFYHILNNVYPIGLGVEVENGIEKVCLENEDYFYGGQIFDIGEAKSISVEPMQLPNILEVGYEDIEIDVINGKSEFNSSQTWELPITNTDSKTENLVNKASASHIEILKIYTDNLYIEKTAKDSTVSKKEDNKIYLIDAKHDLLNEGNFLLSREKFDVVLNTAFSANAFNVALSPRRCLLNRKKWLRTLLFGTIAGRIRQTSATKNALMRSKLITENSVKREDDDITIQGDQLIDLLYLPIYITISINQSKNLIFAHRFLENYNIFAFNYRGNIFYGHIEELNLATFDSSEIEIKMIASKLNDLTKLIR